MGPIFKSFMSFYEKVEIVLFKFARSTPHGMVVRTLDDRNSINLNVSEVFEYVFYFIETSTESVPAD